MSEISKTSLSRVFLIENRARPDHAPSYKSCIRMTALTQGYGDIEKVECPDPYNYDKFIEVGQIRGAEERPTTSLEGRYMMDLLSDLARLARIGCSFDVQLHMGSSQRPDSFDDFEKAIILEDAYISNYGTEDLGALSSDERAAINETADLSAIVFYEVVPLAVSEKASTVVVNEVVDAVICGNISCGGADPVSDGCYTVLAVTVAAGGSPATTSDIIISPDKGVTWYSHDIDSITGSEAASAIDCLRGYAVVVSQATNSLHYALDSELNGIIDPTWTEVTTGFVTGGEPNDIWSTGAYAFIVGENGYIYGTSDATVGVTVLDAGSTVTDDLLAVHGMSEDFAVAVGENGAIVKTEDGSLWAAVTPRPVVAGVHLNTVWVKDKYHWFVGTSDGRLLYTVNAGTTWAEISFPGSGSGVVRDIVFPSDSVGFLAHSTTAPRGWILRSYNGGRTWKRLPEKSGTLPLNDRINAIAYCANDVNFAVGVGLGDNGTDGFVLAAQGA